jgi:hypothetical protein
LRAHANNVKSLNREADTKDLALGFDLNLISALSGEEFVSPLPLQQGWGGGLEVARMAEGRIRKVRNLLFLNFFVDYSDGEAGLWWVPNFRHLDYWYDYTVIQAIEHEIGANGNFERGRNDVFIVGPPEREAIDLSNMILSDVDKCDAVLTYVLLGPRRDSATAATYAAAYEKPIFGYNVSGSLLSVSFDRKFTDDLTQKLGSMVGRKVVFRGARNRPG